MHITILTVLVLNMIFGRFLEDLLLEIVHPVFERPQFLTNFLFIIIHLVPDCQNSRIHHVFLTFNPFIKHSLDAFTDTTNLSVQLHSELIALLVHPLLQAVFDLHRPLFGGNFKFTLLDLDFVHQDVFLLVHVLDHALQDRLLVRQLGIYLRVSGAYSALCFRYYFVHLLVFLSERLVEGRDVVVGDAFLVLLGHYLSCNYRVLVPVAFDLLQHWPHLVLKHRYFGYFVF